MFTKSPNFKIVQMEPLANNYKTVTEEEPEGFENENTRKIQFNNKFILCTYKPNQTVTQVRLTIEKLRGIRAASWMHPSFDNTESKIVVKSILKNSLNRPSSFSNSCQSQSYF